MYSMGCPVPSGNESVPQLLISGRKGNLVKRVRNLCLAVADREVCRSDSHWSRKGHLVWDSDPTNNRYMYDSMFILVPTDLHSLSKGV